MAVPHEDGREYDAFSEIMHRVFPEGMPVPDVKPDSYYADMENAAQYDFTSDSELAFGQYALYALGITMIAEAYTFNGLKGTATFALGCVCIALGAGIQIHRQK